MSEGLSFSALCSLFVDSLVKKAHSYVGDSLTPFQRSRLGESMTIEIRKLCDMAFPAARTPMMSAAAWQKADLMGAELRQVTWHGQKKVDDYQVFRYEHFYPVYEIRLALARAADINEGLRVLDRMLWVAWVTKEEKSRLDLLKFGKSRPNPYVAYEKARIDLFARRPVRAALRAARFLHVVRPAASGQRWWQPLEASPATHQDASCTTANTAGARRRTFSGSGLPTLARAAR